MFDELALFGFALPIPVINTAPALPAGIHCPFCRSPSIRSDGPLEIDRYTAARYIRCSDCRNAWTDIFELATYPV